MPDPVGGTVGQFTSPPSTPIDAPGWNRLMEVQTGSIITIEILPPERFMWCFSETF